MCSGRNIKQAIGTIKINTSYRVTDKKSFEGSGQFSMPAPD